MKPVVFVGGGRITRALLAGLRLANFRRSLVVYDHHPEKLPQLKKLYGIGVERDLDRAIAEAGIVVIAVRPKTLRGLLEEIGGVHRTLPIISLVAGVPLARLQKRLPAPVRWARAMPSPACRGRRGLTALTFGRDFPAGAKQEVRKLFAAVGQILEIPERNFDAFMVTFSCTHGYHALAALSAAAERSGLDKKTALIAATHALADGIIAWKHGRISLEALLQEAATPGGIAAGTMQAMDRAGYQRTVLRGLAAGLSRARQNSKLI